MFKQPICEEVWGGENGKYRLVDSDGNQVDQTPEDTCKRVAKGLSEVEEKDSAYWEEKFASLMLDGKFSGGGRIMANVGSGDLKKNASPINCVVSVQISDDMQAIMQAAKEAAMTLKAGCGIGYDFSTIRPKNAYVHGAGSGTSGVISFMKIFDTVASTVLSGGGRRAAQLGCLDVQHPEIESYITCKRQDGVLRYFNLSVAVSDAFFNAVLNDESWALWFWEKTTDSPDSSSVFLVTKDHTPYDHKDNEYFKFSKDHADVESGSCTEDTIFKKRIYKVLKARDLFNTIMKSNYDFAEPGLLIIDRINQENNLHFAEHIRTANPCVAKGTLVNTPSGYRKVEDIGIGDYISTVIGSEPVKEIEVHKNYPIKKVVFSDGGVQYVTAAHQYHVLRKDDKKSSVLKKVSLVKVEDLRVGDKVRVEPALIAKDGSDDDYRKGLMIGILLGDGCYTKKSMATKSGYIKIASNQDEVSYNKNVKNLFEKYGILKDDLSKNSRSMSIILKDGFDALKDLNLDHGYSHEKYFPQEKVTSKMMAVGILDGLIATDGNINLSSNHPQLRIMTSSKKMAQMIRDLFLAIGCHGIITTSNDKGGVVDGREIVRRHEKNTINVSGSSLGTYSCLTRLKDIHPEKGERMLRVRTDFVCTGNTWRASVKEISDAGYADVYDLYCEESDTWITSGYVQRGCGEQVLSPRNVCLLGSFILPPYVSNAFEENSNFDWETFISDIRIANRMLDNVVDINNLPLEEQRNALYFNRRHGLGFTGLGTILNMLCMRYGSPESVEFAEKLMRTIAQESFKENIRLAKEKGPAKVFETLEARKLTLESGFHKRLLESFGEEERKVLAEDVLKYGLRFSHSTSIAPTGTMSLTWGNNCSNGIEPSFSNSYMRNIRMPGKKTKVQQEVFSYEYLEWKNKYGERELPEWWSVTDNLSVDDHVSIQSVVQKWVDSAVSKTVNIPVDYPFEEFKNVYINGWKSGLKGITTFRFNPEAFSGVLVKKEDLEETKYVFVLEDGSEVIVNGTDEVEYDGELHNAANLFDALKEGMYGDM